MRVCLIEQVCMYNEVYKYQKKEKERVWGRKTEREIEREKTKGRKERGRRRKEGKEKTVHMYTESSSLESEY